MGDFTTDLPQEVSVKVSQRFEDVELVHRSQAGDTEAFGELITKYRTKIFNVIYGMVGNESDAWDLAQEGFLKAWRSIERFHGRSSFHTWLYRITMNVTIDYLRRRSGRSEVELDDATPSFLPDPSVNYERAEIREQVYAALAQLAPDHCAVIVLKELEDLKCQEIADMLNISIGTVLSRLFYGRKKLRSILSPILNRIPESQIPPPAINLNSKQTTTRTEPQIVLAVATQSDKMTAGVLPGALGNLASKEVKRNGEFVHPGFGQAGEKKRKAP